MHGSHSSQNGFLVDLPVQGDGETVSKKRFAEIIGISQGRVSQLIAAGLPVDVKGRINLKMGKAWYIANTDANRRKAGNSAPADLIGPLDLNRLKAKREELALQRELGAVIDRQEAERILFAMIRQERDSWMGWATRAGIALAGELGTDVETTCAALARLVRGQLADLAASTDQEAQDHAASS